MKKIIMFFFFVSIIEYTQSQNLVVNPSFEDTIPCSSFINLGTSQLQPVGWFSPTSGSPDYFNSLYAPFCYTATLPSNPSGFQFPKTGVAILGICTYVDSTILPNFREYIEGQLTDTLIGGHTYCVSFYVASADRYKFVADGMGLKFTIDSLIDYSISTNLPVIPDIFNPSGNVLSDTMNWTVISGNYSATGGEKFITIGNFLPDSLTIIDSLNNNVSTGYRVTYYYIDEISVTDCTVGINNINPASTQSKLYPNPTKQTQVYYTTTLAANQTGNLQVTDMLGKVLATYNLNSGSNKITINTAAYAKGVYVVKVNVGGMAGERLKLVVQ